MKKFLILLCILGLCGCGQIAEPIDPNGTDLSSSGVVVTSVTATPEITVTDTDSAVQTVTTTSKAALQPQTITDTVQTAATTSETAPQPQTAADPIQTAATTSETAPQQPQTTAADRTELVSESELSKTETPAEAILSSDTSNSASVSTSVPVTSVSTEDLLLPTEAVSAEASQPDAENFCTISIECTTVFDNLNDLEKGKEEILPEDGIILPPTAAGFSEGESVFDVLQRVCRENKIHMESSWTPMYNSAYIEGINNLYEFDCGSGSGWMYCVNGVYPNYGCSSYILKQGEVVEWRYTCDLGKDIGGDILGG